jgi:hypothetical protein
MTAATGRVFGPKPFDALRLELSLPLAASVAPYRNWLMGLNLSTGYVVAQAAGVTGLVSAGFSDWDSDGGAVAGGATDVLRSCVVSGFPMSSESGDDLDWTDVGAPCYAVDNQTVGKKSHSTAGVNRSLLGVALGYDVDNSTPIILPGILGWLLGRAAAVSDTAQGGVLYKAVDAGAATDTVNGLAEALMARPPLHGTVSEISLTFEGTTLAITTGDNGILTVYKRDGAGGNAVVLGTLNTVTKACTQWTKNTFVLSTVAGALDLLETDLVTVVRTHAASGAIIPAGNIRVTLKVG